MIFVFRAMVLVIRQQGFCFFGRLSIEEHRLFFPLLIFFSLLCAWLGFPFFLGAQSTDDFFPLLFESSTRTRDLLVAPFGLSLAN